MKLSKVKQLVKSQRVVNSAIRQILWQNLSSLVQNAPRLAKAEMNAYRSIGAKKVVDSFDTKSAIFWGVFAQCEDRGIQYIPEDEIEKLADKAPTMSNDVKIQQKAAASGRTIQEIKEREMKNYREAMEKANERVKTATASIMDGEYKSIHETEEIDDLAEITAETLCKKATEAIDWLIDWDKPDYAEIMIIREDLKNLEKFLSIEENEDTSVEELSLTGEQSAQEKAYMRIVNG